MRRNRQILIGFCLPQNLAITYGIPLEHKFLRASPQLFRKLGLESSLRCCFARYGLSAAVSKLFTRPFDVIRESLKFSAPLRWSLFVASSTFRRQAGVARRDYGIRNPPYQLFEIHFGVASGA